MKISKLTLGLMAVGLVSLASVRAEETSTAVLTALSSTTVSGYVDTSAQWNPGTGTVGPAFAFGAGKRDGFNLNVVSITLEKPLEEAEWSAGYKVDFLLGPDAGGITGGGAIRQAYVALRAPVGNGLDFKIGRWDSIVGYESNDGYKNPNYTRSYAYSLSPKVHTGILMSYQALDYLTLNLGVANTANTVVSGAINARSPRAETHKTYMGSVAITAPDSWGFLAGSGFFAGIVDGFGVQAPGAIVSDVTEYYVGATFATPVEGLRLGATYSFYDNIVGKGTDGYAAAAYVSFKATEKLGFHVRGEYVNDAIETFVTVVPGASATTTELLAVTATVQYDLWENVLSRLEFRWDHDLTGLPTRPWGTASGTAGGRRNDFLLAANVVYKF
jgi:hypothetical protein